MTATEELRRMLDERGVEWAEYGGGYTEFWVRTAVDGERYYIDVKHYTVQPNVMCSLVVAGLTPEQAIAATLGAGTCHLNRVSGFPSMFDARRCDNCWNVAVYDSKHEPKACPYCGRRVVAE